MKKKKTKPSGVPTITMNVNGINQTWIRTNYTVAYVRYLKAMKKAKREPLPYMVWMD